MGPITELHGVNIPERLWGDRDKALLYAAGFLHIQTPRKDFNSAPEEIRDIWEKYREPDLYNNVRDQALSEYVIGFTVGGGGLGSQPLPEKQRISTRRTDNKPFHRT